MASRRRLHSDGCSFCGLQLASLNYPNIAHIYGVEERASVMELVEGESPKARGL
jgi:hypothetical protein